MDYRDFKFEDKAVRHNLHRLDHFSGQDYALDNRMLDDFLVSIIQTHELLPKALQSLISISNCYAAGAHWDTTQERRDRLWSRIRADLNAGLDAVILKQSESLQLDLADRPETCGERILALLARIKAGEDEIPLIKQIQQSSAGTEVFYDAAELLRLLQRKRIPDRATHEAAVTRRLHHIEAVANRLHHIP